MPTTVLCRGGAWGTTVGTAKQKAAESCEAICHRHGLFRERGVEAVGLNERTRSSVSQIT